MIRAAQGGELRTERLVLRPFRLGDVDDVLAYATSPGYARYLFRDLTQYGRRDAEEFVAREVLRDPAEETQLAITLNGRVIGGIHLGLDGDTGTANLGYGIAREQWGKGIVVEAATALFDWAFASMEGLARIEAHADARNQQSCRVMEKLGMQREGVLRKRRTISGERADVVVYGILREEWAARPGL